MAEKSNAERYNTHFSAFDLSAKSGFSFCLTHEFTHSVSAQSHFFELQWTDRFRLRIEGMAMTNLDRITIDPMKMNGQPCIRGMRLTVRRVLEALAIYPDRCELMREYPELEEEDIRQALTYAAAHLDDKVLEIHGV